MSKTPMWMRTDEEHAAAEKQREDKDKKKLIKWFRGLSERTQEESLGLVILSSEDSEEGRRAAEQVGKWRGELPVRLLKIAQWKLAGDLD